MFLKTNIQRDEGEMGKENGVYIYKIAMAYLEHTSAIVQTIATWPIVGASDEVEWDMAGSRPDIGLERLRKRAPSRQLCFHSLTRSCDPLFLQR